MSTTTRPTPVVRQQPARVLRADRMYGTYDRFVCGRIDCAGYSAVHTGFDIYGGPVVLIRPDDVKEWRLCGMGELVCEGGHLVAVDGLPNPDGSARTREVQS